MTTAFFQLNTMTYDYPTPTSDKFDEMANINLDATEKNIITLKKTPPQFFSLPMVFFFHFWWR